MPVELLKTGIAGFEKAYGGLPKGRTLLLAGPVGSYTELFGLEFLYRGAAAKENTLYVSFEKKEEDVVAMASVFDWKFEEQIADKRLNVMSSELFNYEQFISSLEDNIFSIKAGRVVFDSISYLGGFFNSPFKFRASLGELRRMLNRHDCTTMLISEAKGSELSPYGVEEFLVDGVIHLQVIKKGGELMHAISIPEMDGMDTSSQLYPLEMTKKGMRVRNIPLI